MASLSPPRFSLSRNLTLSQKEAGLHYLGLARRQVGHLMPLRDESSVSQATGVQSYPFSSRLMSTRCGDSIVTGTKLCKVIWSLEVQLTEGDLVYLTGEPVALGCWNPDLAVPLSPSLHTAHLWETEIMVPFGTQVQYNYFIRRESSSWPVVFYQRGPKLSLYTPPSCMGNEPLHVKDCWVIKTGHRNRIPSWDSWLFDQSLNQDPFKHVNGSLNQASFLGQHDMLKSQNVISLREKPPLSPSKGIEESCTEAKFSIRDQPTGDPCIQSMEDKESYIEEKLHTRDKPDEEPWLLFPQAFQIEESNQEKAPSISDIVTVPENSEIEKISTKILINSSACDMRRIAVLENGVLVELILEPLNNSVLFINNIYLGVIKEMMPKLGGALVDIGLTEPVFMIMREYREPFVYSTKKVQGAITEKDNSECREEVNKWARVCIGDKIMVQVIQREEGRTGNSTDSVMLTPYPRVRSRFWILRTRNRMIDVPVAVEGPERVRLLAIAKALKPAGFSLKALRAAVGRSSEELEKDLEILLSTWDGIVEHAKSAVQAAGDGIEGAVPAMLHRAMDQKLAVIYDYFPDKVESVLVDSPRSYHEVTIDLQEIAPELCSRVELYKRRTPIFDEYKIEEEINRILCKSVPLPGGGYLVIEQTEAFVSIDVNSGRSMLGKRENASSKVNLAAAKQIARELRLRDIGGVIIVDFIDMTNDSNRILVYEEMKKEVERDRSKVTLSEISSLGLMQITRERVHHSHSFVISEPCKGCHATGRVEALETSFSKIEHEISRFLAASNEKPDPRKPKSWPRFLLKVDRHMGDYLTSGKRKKLAILSSSLKVWILLKIARGFSWGTFELTPLRGGKENYE